MIKATPPAPLPPTTVSQRRLLGSTAAGLAFDSPQWASAGDADLLALCEQATAIETAGSACDQADFDRPIVGNPVASSSSSSRLSPTDHPSPAPGNWDRIVSRLSALPARTWPGVQAKPG